MARPSLDPSEVEHGTLRGYDWHRRKDVPIPDDDSCGCAEAKRIHSRDHQRKKQAEKAADEPRRRAWWNACSRLAANHKREFREILLEELRKVGYIPPEEEQGDD